jgi:hypothetical protein
VDWRLCQDQLLSPVGCEKQPSRPDPVARTRSNFLSRSFAPSFVPWPSPFVFWLSLALVLSAIAPSSYLSPSLQKHILYVRYSCTCRASVGRSFLSSHRHRLGYALPPQLSPELPSTGVPWCCCHRQSIDYTDAIFAVVHSFFVCFFAQSRLYSPSTRLKSLRISSCPPGTLDVCLPWIKASLVTTNHSISNHSINNSRSSNLRTSLPKRGRICRL